jgi:hypothetical protein
MNDIKKEMNRIMIPDRLHLQSRLGVERVKKEEGRLEGKGKKRMISAILAASLLLPTGAIAYQSISADELYGSYQEVKRQISGATMKGYMMADAKLTKAKGDLTTQEYSQFKQLLQVIVDSKMLYGNENGNIDYSAIPEKEVDTIKETLFKIQPIFDKLNGQPSSKEVLTEGEYKQYIEALMVYEQIRAQNGTLSSEDTGKIPAESRAEYLEASNFLQYVNDQQMKGSQ